MPLPAVPGWMIDFQTAKAIFDSGNNLRIAHCVEMCSSGSFFICHHEEALFKNCPQLAGPFIKDQNCMFQPDKAIMQQCSNVASNPKCKKLLKGNQTPIVLTAIASYKNFGVISDHRSPVFTTVYDLSTHFGIPTYSADDYFAMI